MKSVLLILLASFSLVGVADDEHDGICLKMNDNDPGSEICRTLVTRHDCMMFPNKCVWSAYHREADGVYRDSKGDIHPCE